MEFFHILILAILLLLFFNMLQNFGALSGQQKAFRLKEPLPLISVLIPARNEEENIRKCVSSLLKQTYTNLEIIVLDDDSRDRTFEILQELCAFSEKLKVVRGEKTPAGWNGKNWACHQLATMARGEWFLFTDADTIHKPRSVAEAFAAAQRNKATLVTCVPGLITKTWSERLYLPIINFAFFVLLPFRLINYSRVSRLALGVGPFMFIQRDFYLSCGGYEAIKREIVDDIALAKVVKKKGGQVTVLDGTKFVDVRFYTNFNDLWSGFSKNSYEAIGSTPYNLAGVLIACYFLFIYPYLSLWGAIESHQSFIVPFSQVLVLCAMRIILALKFDTSIFYGLLHPLSVFLWILILFNSFRLSVFKKKFEWKERFYPIDN